MFWDTKGIHSMSRVRNVSAVVSALLMAGLLLVACGPKAAPAPQPGTGSPDANAPAVGGELNLRMAKDPDNFNPILSATAYGGEISGQVYANRGAHTEKGLVRRGHLRTPAHQACCTGCATCSGVGATAGLWRGRFGSKSQA